MGHRLAALRAAEAPLIFGYINHLRDRLIQIRLLNDSKRHRERTFIFTADVIYRSPVDERVVSRYKKSAFKVAWYPKMDQKDFF